MPWRRMPARSWPREAPGRERLRPPPEARIPSPGARAPAQLDRGRAGGGARMAQARGIGSGDRSAPRVPRADGASADPGRSGGFTMRVFGPISVDPSLPSVRTPVGEVPTVRRGDRRGGLGGHYPPPRYRGGAARAATPGVFLAVDRRIRGASTRPLLLRRRARGDGRSARPDAPSGCPRGRGPVAHDPRWEGLALAR